MLIKKGFSPLVTMLTCQPLDALLIKGSLVEKLSIYKVWSRKNSVKEEVLQERVPPRKSEVGQGGHFS